MTADIQDVSPHRQMVDVITEIWLRSGHFEDATQAIRLVGAYLAENGADKTRTMLKESPEEMGIRPRSERPNMLDVFEAFFAGAPMPAEYIPGTRLGAWIQKNPDLAETIDNLVDALDHLNLTVMNTQKQETETKMKTDTNHSVKLWKLCLSNDHRNGEARIRAAVKESTDKLTTFRWVIGKVASTISMFSENAKLAADFNREALGYWAQEWREMPHPGDALRSSLVGLMTPAQLTRIAGEVPAEGGQREDALRLVVKLGPLYERAAYEASRRLKADGDVEGRDLFQNAVTYSQRAVADAHTGINYLRGHIHKSQLEFAPAGYNA